VLHNSASGLGAVSSSITVSCSLTRSLVCA
jgi:hypothetical protein